MTSPEASLTSRAAGVVADPTAPDRSTRPTRRPSGPGATPSAAKSCPSRPTAIVTGGAPSAERMTACVGPATAVTSFCGSPSRVSDAPFDGCGRVTAKLPTAMSAAPATKAAPNRRPLRRRGIPSDVCGRPVRRSSASAASNARPEMPASAAAARRSATAKSSSRTASNSLARARRRDAIASGSTFRVGFRSRGSFTTHLCTGDGGLGPVTLPARWTARKPGTRKPCLRVGRGDRAPNANSTATIYRPTAREATSPRNLFCAIIPPKRRPPSPHEHEVNTLTCRGELSRERWQVYPATRPRHTGAWTGNQSHAHARA